MTGMRWQGGWRGLVRDLLLLAAMAAVFSAVYAVGELIVYGRVR